jgi:hypothetical protein
VVHTSPWNNFLIFFSVRKGNPFPDLSEGEATSTVPALIKINDTRVLKTRKHQQ